MLKAICYCYLYYTLELRYAEMRNESKSDVRDKMKLQEKFMRESYGIEEDEKLKKSVTN